MSLANDGYKIKRQSIVVAKWTEKTLMHDYAKITKARPNKT